MDAPGRTLRRIRDGTGSGRRCVRGCRVDLEGISALLTAEGWALLESLPAYDEPTRWRWANGCAGRDTRRPWSRRR